MKRAVAAAALLGGLLSLGADTPDGSLRRAADAWDRGDYVSALSTYLELLDSSPNDSVVETIALQTGELYRTVELTPDGSAPQFSPDGRFVAFESGQGAFRTTKLIATQSWRHAATLQGHSVSFSPDGGALVYLQIPDSPEIADLQAQVDRASAGERTLRADELAEAVGRLARIVIRDLSTGLEKEIATGTIRRAAPTLAAEETLVFVGWTAAGESDQIYVVRDGSAPKALTSGDGDKAILDINADGTFVLFGPRRRGSRDDGESGGATFGLVNVVAGTTKTLAGSAPAFSGDGRSVAFVTPCGAEHCLSAAPIEKADAATVIRQGRERLGAPALSGDGSRVAFQMMLEDDWEIFVVNRDGSGETRLTREIQHDVRPRFLTDDRIVAAIGEARHRRSYLYELRARTRTRLFHNNTVRTIAPEYAWVPNRNGTMLLISAERDGDTISPARGVYLVDLTRRVTRGELRERVAMNLNAERALRAKGQRIYAPISGAVREVVEGASVGRVFEYEKALYDFDSKHITRPGNRLAATYLFETYRSFGYEPEYQWFTPRGDADATANVLATLKGTVNPELIYVVSSHYDSVVEGPGADDNSSGTAALLETARILQGRPQPATIIFASFTGEESGLLGSREFVRRAQENKLRIVGALNNDMVGWANDHRLDNTIRYSNSGIRDLQHAAAMHFTNLVTYDALYYKSTDAAAYHEAYGDIVGGIGSYPILGNPHYHEPHDVLESINHRLVTEVAKTTAASVMLLASSPSRITGLKVDSVRDGSARISWSPAPETGITHYVVAWGPLDAPVAQQMQVQQTAATIRDAKPGTIVSVKAVNAKGLEGWDWADIKIESK